jgi:ribonuclease P protein subunit POP4
MSELLGLTTVDTLGEETAHAMKAAMPSAAGMHAKLVKADFHGSIMTSQSFSSPVSVCFFVLLTLAGYDDTARRSKNASLVGVSGIVVQETENTFKVVTRKDKSKGAYILSLCPSIC